MKTYEYKGVQILPTLPFKHDSGTTYPANRWHLMPEEELIALGVSCTEPEAPKAKLDSRFYWGYSSDGSPIEKELEDKVQKDEYGEPQLVLGVKSNLKDTINTKADSLLAPTDKWITAESERGKPVALEVKAYRQAVLHFSDELNAMVTACTTTAALEALYAPTEDVPAVAHSWPDPEDPDSWMADYVPDQVSRRQARKALMLTTLPGHTDTLFSQVEAYMTTVDLITKNEWENAQVFKRTDPLVAAIAVMFSLSSGEIDELFRFAETL